MVFSFWLYLCIGLSHAAAPVLPSLHASKSSHNELPADRPVWDSLQNKQTVTASSNCMLFQTLMFLKAQPKHI